eukprot:CAMPEP_0172803478 /NCGR_PEP_ID=MMETSP1075-20121228/4531_1 /TAXON_ID=2916 /ORGANISM="Ceratium fusus, Strain PA161109" /LENGTH=470 /DNA_ID=CAMNT_0013641911 /DNA_START=75 /DNA_END=1490 /DNA_ORIENTATION=-
MGGGVELPMSLKVKNTFIDVNSLSVEDNTSDPDDVEFPECLLSKRQVSEPLPCIRRQISGSNSNFCRAPGPPILSPKKGLQTGGLLEEENEFDEADESDEREEPETEQDPQWVMDTQAERLETEEPLWGPSLSVGTFGRQETEMCWPSWGFQQTAQQDPKTDVEPMLAPAATGLSQQDMWMFQMSGQSDTAPLEPEDDEKPTAASWAKSTAEPFVPYSTAGAPTAEDACESLSALPGAPAGNCYPAPTGEWSRINTVMLRNLPNKYTQVMLLEELMQSGFIGTFDFLYLPIDPETNANRGYAFINFTDPSYANMLRMAYEGKKMCRFNSDKVVSVAPAALQGFEANFAHYSAARVSRGDPSARPLFLRESSMKDFGTRKQEGNRRRGGRRTGGSLIDMAAKQHVQTQPPALRQLQQQQQPLSAAKVAAPPSAKEGGTSQVTPKFCPYCGGGCKPQFRFCQFCGASLQLTN